MKEINLRSEEINSFKIISLQTFESNVYLFENKVYKIYKGNFYGNHYNDKQLENKLRKIELLHKMDLSDSFLIPQELIYINNHFRGYTMDYFKGKEIIEAKRLRRKRKIYLLKKMNEIIKEAHEKGIILNDINLGNFLYEGLTVKCCDLDNSKFLGYEQDILNMNLGRFYIPHYPNIDENSDNFLFILNIFMFLTGLLPNQIFNIDYMKTTGLLKDKDILEFYNNFIALNREECNPEELISLCEHQKRFIL